MSLVRTRLSALLLVAALCGSAYADGSQYPLMITVIGCGSITRSPDHPLYEAGTPVTISVVACPCWHFVGWSGDVTGTANPLTFVMSGNRNIRAVFEINRYSIATSAGPGGSIVPSGNVSVPCGSNQAVTITPDAGHAIAYVKVDQVSVGVTDLYTFTNVRENHTIEAAFIDDVTTPTLLTLFEAVGSDNGVELHWRLAERDGLDALWVERGESAAGPWVQALVDVREEADVTVAVDRDVAGGRRYHYRLVTRVGGDLLVLGQTSASAPLDRRLAIARIAPNPSRGRMLIAYVLPQEVHARVSIVDVQGRTVATLVSGLLPAGHHEAHWSGEWRGGEAPAGVYFVCIEALGTRLERRFVRVR